MLTYFYLVFALTAFLLTCELWLRAVKSRNHWREQSDDWKRCANEWSVAYHQLNDAYHRLYQARRQRREPEPWRPASEGGIRCL